MIIYQEKIEPPRVLVADDQMEWKTIESKDSEGRLVKNVINALTGIIRDLRRATCL